MDLNEVLQRQIDRLRKEIEAELRSHTAYESSWLERIATTRIDLAK